MSVWFFLLAQFTLLAYALVGGVFLAFSDFIMRSHTHTDGMGDIEAMQVINREVFRWIFMSLFLGLALVSILVFGCSMVHLSGPGASLIAPADVIYFIGCFGVTIAFNVPTNQALAGMDLSDDVTRDYWHRVYVPRWTLWNTVRTMACAVSSTLLMVGLLWMAQTHSA
jgi:uncharacterized membrane protein